MLQCPVILDKIRPTVHYIVKNGKIKNRSS